MLGAGVGGLVLGGALHRLDRARRPPTRRCSRSRAAKAPGSAAGSRRAPRIDPTDRAARGRARARRLRRPRARDGAVARRHASTPTSPRTPPALSALWTGAGAGAGALAEHERQGARVGPARRGHGGPRARRRAPPLDRARRRRRAPAHARDGRGPVARRLAPLRAARRATPSPTAQRAGALALGGFGAAGVATLVSGAFELVAGARRLRRPRQRARRVAGRRRRAPVAVAARSRAASGSCSAARRVGPRARASASRRASAPSRRRRALGGAAAGAALGVSESLLFAWSGARQRPAAVRRRGARRRRRRRVARPRGRRDADERARLGARDGGLRGLGRVARARSRARSSGTTRTRSCSAASSAPTSASSPATGSAALDIVEPRDFGWLSLFGALGTVAGAGVARRSRRGSSTPIRAGLAIGPTVGMLVGRARAAAPAARAHAEPAPATARRARRGADATRRETEPATRSPTTRDRRRRGPTTRRRDAEGSSLGARGSRRWAAVTDWQPLVGALPASADGGPAPVLFGLTGHWK